MRVSIPIETHGDQKQLVMAGSNNARGGPTKPEGMDGGYGNVTLQVQDHQVVNTTHPPREKREHTWIHP